LIEEELSMNKPKTTLQKATDPIESARSRVSEEQERREMHWLAAHWPEILLQAYGKYVAVVEEQFFIADTAEQAIALAQAAHPDNDGILAQYVFPPGGARLYGHPRGMRTL
jgi:hypothetical protein